MKIINKIKKELNCDIKKYSFFNNIKYIETSLGNFIIKKSDIDSIYKKLQRNNFDNYIEYQYELDDYKIFPYIDDMEVDDNEKALDIIHLMSKLHKNTSYYKNISPNYIKDIYEKKKQKIEELNNYYEYLRFIFEEQENITPTGLYFLKNMSIVFISLDKAKYYLDEWYKNIKTQTTQRVSLTHNNLKLSHIIENNRPYLISWEHADYNVPIYDFLVFYKNEFDKINFTNLIDIYTNNINLSNEEQSLLYYEMLMPKMINLSNSQIKNIYDLTYEITYLSTTNNLISKKDKINQTHQEN